ncbi:class I SAM-dependent methyltransferase [Ensifer sp. NPDC090286]|uniref:class I SAM-dependent methyltransferase n=1 Tax=Ensifer sp. NPDC090286 TaxID=3363991 RepID=UPI00383A3326
MKPFNAHTERLLRAALPRTCLIFDVGCGNGEIAFWLAENCGHTVYGVDPRLPLPRGYWHSVTDLSRGEVRLMNGHVESLNPDHKFDCVLALGLLHSLGGRGAVDTMLGRLCQWTKPGALLALSWLSSTRSSSKRHYGVYHPTEDEVLSRLANFGASLQCTWNADIIHSDGGTHCHRAVYALWRTEHTT